MKIKRKLSKALYEIYTQMEKEGLFNDCNTTEEYAQAMLPMLSVQVSEKSKPKYEEQLLFFTNLLVEGKVIEYALVKRVVGTEPYVTARLEQDIRDVWEYLIVPSSEVRTWDKVYRKSIIIDELEELREEFREADYYAECIY